MNFDFSDDQRRLQAEVQRMLAEHSNSAAVRRVLDGGYIYCHDSWRQLADIGALGIAIPENDGGAGMTHLELCLIAEEAGRALAAVPLSSSIYLAAEAIKRCTNQTQKTKWLSRLSSGEIIGTAMITSHHQHAFRSDELRLTDNKLSGTLNAAPDGMAADICVMLVGDKLALIDLSANGVTRTKQASLDPTRSLAKIVCNNVPADILAETGGKEIAAKVSDGAAVLIAFEQIGGAERALYAARDYVMERRAFGRIVGGFQAVKHRLAEIYTAIELARAHAYFGAWALATDADELPRAAAAARVAATQAYNLAAEEGLHLHGGIGFTWETDCHIHLRRSRWLGQIIGNEHFWRERLAATLIEEAA